MKTDLKLLLVFSFAISSVSSFIQKGVQRTKFSDYCFNVTKQWDKRDSICYYPVNVSNDDNIETCHSNNFSKTCAVCCRGVPPTCYEGDEAQVYCDTQRTDLNYSQFLALLSIFCLFLIGPQIIIMISDWIFVP